MKNNCVVCNNKTSIWTRQRLKDGFLCSDCAKKCSEHLEDFDKISTEEIKRHLAYRKENQHSERLENFTPTKSLGEYEILRIDEINGYWLLKTEKRFNNHNPDIFKLSQITDVSFLQKKECLNQFDEEKASRKFNLKKNRHPIYGYWFYVIIKVDHPCFTEISMRINKYIINEKNQIEYLGAVRNAQNIVDIVTELADKNKKATQNI